MTAQERRALQRSRTFWKGTILFPGGLRSIECTVRNFTAAGAKLDCGAVSDIPNHFELKIPQRGGQTFACAVAWRQGQEVGVSFVPRTEPEASAIAEKLRMLEAQNRRLMREMKTRGDDRD